MKKRPRKKKHLGELTEWGCQLRIMRNSKEKFDEFLDAFIEATNEVNGSYCYGGEKEDKLGVFMELARMSEDSEDRLRKIMAWLEGRINILEYTTSPASLCSFTYYRKDITIKKRGWISI